MLIGLIESNDPTREFHGYVDKKASNKKIMTNVFKRGDKYFLTGMLQKVYCGSNPIPL